jgi:RND family efflux transporter MFP subunit
MRTGRDKILSMVPSRAAACPLLLAAVLAVSLAGCQRHEASPPAAVGRTNPAPRTAASPRPAELAAVAGTARTEGWIGVIVARASVDVTADTPGRLAAIQVQIGDQVQRGDRIASLDTRLAAQDLEMARSALRGAEADAGRATAEANEAQQRAGRRRDNPDFFSKEDIASAELAVKTSAAALQAAQARVGEQRARVRQLEASLGQSDIRAPFAGRVAERFVDAGTVVGPGTHIVRLISGGDLLVRAAVPPEEARTLAVGRPVTIHVRTQGLAIPGRIERISPEIDAASQMILLEARLEPPPGTAPRLQAGLVVDVTPGGPV